MNEGGLTSRIKNGLDGKPLGTPTNGYLDTRRWDSTGNPATHSVLGVTVDGPIDGVQYFYKVASVDLLGLTGRRAPPRAE